MSINALNVSLWYYLLLTYLLVGFCTQLPGVAYGHFLQLSHFRHLQTSGFLIKSVVGICWLIFSSILWFVPFLRVGLNYIALELVAVGFLAAYVVAKWASTSVVGALFVFAAGIVSVFLARPRKRWPTLF